MAQKRMFSLQIVDSDVFLEMPMTSQLLYFHLSMRADDEGFIGNPKKIIRMIGSNEDDLRLLLAKRFLMVFDSGVIIVKHWLIHNTIRMDRFNPTSYKKEKATLGLKENRGYTEIEKAWQPLGNHLATQVKLSKVNLIKKNASFKEKKPFYEGQEMRLSKGKWWVIPKEGGSWLEFADTENKIEWK